MAEVVVVCMILVIFLALQIVILDLLLRGDTLGLDNLVLLLRIPSQIGKV